MKSVIVIYRFSKIKLNELTINKFKLDEIIKIKVLFSKYIMVKPKL
jgi:hypothetical protein